MRKKLKNIFLDKNYVKISALVFIYVVPATSNSEVYFDPAMISGSSEAVADISRFNSEGNQLPGRYLVDVFLNSKFVFSREVNFVSTKPRKKGFDESNHSQVKDDTGLMACLTINDFAQLDVKTDVFPKMEPAECISSSSYISGSYTKFDFQQMRLDISIPQAALINRPTGWISPETWDDGINAGLLSWQLTGSENKANYGDSRRQFLNLTSGINIGAWRLRDNSTWNYNENRYGTSHEWDHINTYLQRAIIPWNSEFTIGDNATGSEIFDSLSFRGFSLSSDENMYPDTARGFAPIVKGIAASNAEISIKQNGNIIYRTFVAPGSFSISDLYPLSSGGDLEVSVLESDGKVKVFTVPYSSVPLLQRQGHIRYEITYGNYRSNSENYDSPAFTQGTFLWGLPHNVTIYGGTQLSSNYQSASVGTGINMGEWGALSADITNANSTLADKSHHQGQSVRFLYGRSLISTGTTFQLAGYRFSTEGFHTLDETALGSMSGWVGDSATVDATGKKVKNNWLGYYNLYNIKKDKMQATISQNLSDLGSIYLNGSRQSYWNTPSTTTSVMAGFSSSYGRASYTLSYSYSRASGQSEPDNSIYLSLSVPLDALISGFDKDSKFNSAWANYSVTRDSSGNLANQLSLSGTALEEKNLDWSISQGYGRVDGRSGDVNLDYKGTYGSGSIGYGYNSNYRQYRYGLSGSAVAYSDGITVGQQLGTTNVLIAVPGANGIPVENGNGVKTDWRGFTILPFATMYRENRVALDVSKLDDFTDIDNSVSRVVPTRGALVRASFKAHVGLRALITIRRNNKFLPFGTIISTEDGNNTGLIGDSGQVYLSGLPTNGILKAQWGNGNNDKCTIHYNLKNSSMKNLLPLINEECI